MNNVHYLYKNTLEYITMRQFDMTTKEFVRSYSFNDIYCDRKAERSKVIKGRTVIELGTRVATCFVGNLYRVFEPSVESYKYLLLVGVAQQNPNYDSLVSVEEAEEAAAIKAFTNPVLTYILDEPLSEDSFIDLSLVLRDSKPVVLIKTPEEKNMMFIEA